LTLGECYDVGQNDGTIFKKVRYVGTKQHYGKPMMCFRTDNKQTITVNPSYNSFCVGQESEIEEDGIMLLDEKGEKNG